jgi:hypothetical protein
VLVRFEEFSRAIVDERESSDVREVGIDILGVDVTHPKVVSMLLSRIFLSPNSLVEVALGDTNDQVVDQGADGAQRSDALARAVVELDLDQAGLGVGEADSQVTEVLGELATGALDDDIPGLDGDLDPLGDFEQFLRVAVKRLSVQFVHSEFCDALVRS